MRAWWGSSLGVEERMPLLGGDRGILMRGLAGRGSSGVSGCSVGEEGGRASLVSGLCVAVVVVGSLRGHRTDAAEKTLLRLA